MKKELIIGIIGVVVFVGLTIFYGSQYNTMQSPSVNQPQTLGTTETKIGTEPIILTLSEIAKHTTSSDCWMIISGKVYSVGSYASAHPGGSRAILSFCGKDGTVAFQTKGGKGSHSQNAVNLLASYYIGDVGGKIKSANPNTQSLSASNTQEDYDD